MRTAIANGEVIAWSSYVTRWNHELKRAELAAGSWCQDGEVSGAQPFVMDKFPVDMLDSEDQE